MFKYRISKCVNGYYWLLLGEDIMIEAPNFYNTREECIQHLQFVVEKYNLKVEGSFENE